MLWVDVAMCEKEVFVFELGCRVVEMGSVGRSNWPRRRSCRFFIRESEYLVQSVYGFMNFFARL